MFLQAPEMCINAPCWI